MDEDDQLDSKELLGPEAELAQRTVDQIAKQNRVPRETVEAVLSWPWKPFGYPSEVEGREVQRLQARGWVPTTDLATWLKDEHNARQIYRKIAERLKVVGHERSIISGGDIGAVIAAFHKHFPSWNCASPDWAAVEKVLQKDCRIDPIQLRELSILDIRRYLAELGYRQDRIKTRKDPASKRTSEKTDRPSRPMTEQERAVWLSIERGMQQKEIAAEMGISPQAVSKFYKLAKKKLQFQSRTGGRSIRASSNTEDFDQRSQRRT